MTARFAFPAPVPRGAAPVGQMSELPALELMVILCLRRWCAGAADRADLAEDLDLVLGHHAAPAMKLFADLMAVVLAGARRPLMRHDTACACFGGDESAFANMCAAAAAQDRDEAMLFATTLIDGALAFEAVNLACALGPALLRLARPLPAKPETRH